MSDNEFVPTSENQTPTVSPGNYSPVTVTVKDTMGAIFLGVLSVILLVGWMNSEKRYLELKSQLEK
ncbi:MAG: hypothetical protein QM730_05360 [Anaerolineales bacterium]